eukprot:450026_1
MNNVRCASTLAVLLLLVASTCTALSCIPTSHACVPCLASNCDPLGPPRHGSVAHSALSPGAVAVYNCDVEYQLIGPKSRRCLTDGEWNGVKPTCMPRKLREKSSKRFRRPTAPDQPFSSVIEMKSLGKSSGRELATDYENVIDQNCPDLSTPTNINLTVTGLVPGSTAFYECLRFFDLKGISHRKCQPNGEWTGSEPSCVRSCPSLRPPLNGSVLVFGTGAGDALATYQCDKAEKFNCTFLKPPIRGSVSITGLSPGSAVTYACARGFPISGVSKRICQENGDWTGEAPICKPLPNYCQSPPVNLSDTHAQLYINDASSMYSGTSGSVDAGTVVISVCERGYLMANADGGTYRAAIVCDSFDDSTGRWNATLSSCALAPTYCPILPSVAYTSVRPGTNTLGAVASFHCTSGDLQLAVNGRPATAYSKTCQPMNRFTGYWTGERDLVECVQGSGASTRINVSVMTSITILLTIYELV